MVKYKTNVNFKVSNDELAEIDRMAKKWGCPRSEVWRRLLYTVRVLFSSDLMLSDVLQINDDTIEVHRLLAQGHDLPLHQAMRSIPELARILRAKETLELVERQKKRTKR